jgi:hypothetical protein
MHGGEQLSCAIQAYARTPKVHEGGEADLIENIPEGDNAHMKVSGEISLPPTLIILSWISGLSFKIFLQDQEQSPGGLSDQKFLSLMRYILTQLVQTDWSLSEHKCQICLIMAMAARFQISTRFIPKPPSFFGLQITSQATFAPEVLSSVPFHKKDLRICSTCLTTPLGRIKREDQQENGCALLTRNGFRASALGRCLFE